MKKSKLTEIEPQIEDLLLEQRVEVVREVRGNTVFHKRVANALQEAEVLAGSEGIVAPLPLLVRSFPSLWMFYSHSDQIRRKISGVTGPIYTANSEEHVGIDRSGKFYSPGEPIVVTVHGGLEGGGLLDSNALLKANELSKLEKDKNKKECWINVFGKPYNFVNLNEVYERKAGCDVLTDLLHNGMPDGSSISVFSYEQYREERSLGVKRHAVVRSFSQLQRDYYKQRFFQQGKFDSITFVLPFLRDNEEVKVSTVKEIMAQSKIANENAQKTRWDDPSSQEVYHKNGELLRLLRLKAKSLFESNKEIFLDSYSSDKIVSCGGMRAAEAFDRRMEDYHGFMRSIHKTLPFSLRTGSYFEYANLPETRSVILGVGYDGIYPIPLTKSGTYVVVKKDQLEEKNANLH